MSRWIIATVLTAAVAGWIASSGGAAATPAGGIATSGGATAAPARPAAKANTFRQVLAAKLGKELDKPPADVLAALKAAPKAAKPVRPAAGTKLTREQRQARRDAAQTRRVAWTASVAKSLGVAPQKVTDAVRALVKQRLDSLVADGWLTQAQAQKREGKLWIGFLRIR